MREGWTKTTLGEIAEVVGGGTPKTTVPEFWGGEIPWVTPTEIVAQHGKSITTTQRTLTDEGLRRSAARLLPKDTILLTSRATIGAVALAGVPIATNQGFASLVCGESVLPRFLMYWCEHHTEQFVARAGGNTFLEVSKKKVAEVPIGLPPLLEQRRIVDLVDSLAAYIARADARAAAAETARRLIVGDGLSNARGWPIRELGDVVDIAIGRQRSPQHASGDYMVPYLRAANVKDGALDLTDVKSMNFTPAEQAAFRLEAGDVLVTEGCGSIAELGASSYWRGGELTGTVCFQNTLLRLRAIEGVTTPDFVELFARYAHHSGLWAEAANGTNIFHIGLRRARQVPIALPSLETQESLSAVSKALQRDASAAEFAALMGRRLRSAVLSGLLTGKHEIPGSYDALLGVAA